MTESKKPRFTRLVKGGKLYLRDREGFKMVGPFASWADALAHIKDAESGSRRHRAQDAGADVSA